MFRLLGRFFICRGFFVIILVLCWMLPRTLLTIEIDCLRHGFHLLHQPGNQDRIPNNSVCLKVLLESPWQKQKVRINSELKMADVTAKRRQEENRSVVYILNFFILGLLHFYYGLASLTFRPCEAYLTCWLSEYLLGSRGVHLFLPLQMYRNWFFAVGPFSWLWSGSNPRKEVQAPTTHCATKLSCK